ncbi:D-beta-hydroxybutyrate dehydrogenase, mitochondrial [Manis javanica]|nr:D-beta-hydroxybutyrate dehydrogenase, mitochondrial [Manis javanica]
MPSAPGGLLPDLLVNNAGFGTHGRFDELALDMQRETIDLNVGALELTHLCPPHWGSARAASSTSPPRERFSRSVHGGLRRDQGLFPSFSEALGRVPGPRGVRVLALCLALPTRRSSPAPARPHPSGKSVQRGRGSPGAESLDDNRASVVHGCANYLTALGARVATREFMARFTARVKACSAAKAKTTGQRQR